MEGIKTPDGRNQDISMEGIKKSGWKESIHQDGRSQDIMMEGIKTDVSKTCICCPRSSQVAFSLDILDLREETVDECFIDKSH